MNLTLIQLVSEQTLQNLLPALALRPGRIIQVKSSDLRFKQTPRHFVDACKVAGLDATDFPLAETIPHDSPDIQETMQCLEAIVARYGTTDLVFNLTGGTKLMSIGAYRVAAAHGIPSLYTDTQNRREFVDAQTGPWASSLPSLAEQVQKLTVPMIMAAQGKDFLEDSFTGPLLEFGREAWRLRLDFHEAISAWTGAIRNSLPRRNKRIDDRPAILRQFLQTPLPSPASAAASDYLDAAAQAGLVRVEPDGRAYLAAEPKKSSVERVSNLLDGAWLELAVADMARSGGRFADLHWSVEPEQRGDDYGETDLIAVDRQKLNLAVISCKTSTEHVSTLEHLSSWRDRARTLGGSHASGHLCLFRAKSPAQASDLCAMGKNMNIQVHIAEAIPACFAEPCTDPLTAPPCSGGL